MPVSAWVRASFVAFPLFWVMTPASDGRESLSKPSGAPDRADVYVLCSGEQSWSTNTSLETLEAVREKFPGLFLWARRAGNEHVIQDQRILDEARALFDPLRQLDPEREALARRQERLEAEQGDLEREQEDVERELDWLSDDPKSDDPAQRRRLERRQRDLEDRQRALESRERELDAVESSIDNRENAMEQKAEAELWRLIDRSIASGIARPVRAR